MDWEDDWPSSEEPSSFTAFARHRPPRPILQTETSGQGSDSFQQEGGVESSNLGGEISGGLSLSPFLEHAISLPL